MGLSIVLMALALAAEPQIKADEQVIFFPTTGWLDRERDRWVVPVHGWIFEPEHDSRLRQRLLFELREALKLEVPSTAAQRFERRAWAFVVDNERGKRITVRVGDETFPLEESAPNGHFQGTLHLPAAHVRQGGLLRDGRWLEYQAVLPAGDTRRFVGRVQLLEPTGVSIISDIDDTIKVSDVAHLPELLANVFWREYQPVPGMPELFRSWAKQGAAVHYVSVSPWQLYEPLAEFVRQQGFPAGSFHLQEFRWKDESIFNLIKSREALKLKAIPAILKAYPERRFILVGDSGEKDPEVYGQLARDYPRQIVRILIRNAGEGEIARARLERAFDSVPQERWQIFRRPEEITPLRFGGGEERR